MKSHVLLLIVLMGGVVVARGAGPAKPDADLSPAQLEQKLVQFLKEGKQSEAEKLLFSHASAHRNNQDVVFLRAALTRSRFMVPEAFRLFAAAAELGKDTPRGKCATYVMDLDRRRNVEENFAALGKLVEANPEDIFLRWMIAVECRTFDKNRLGADHYKKILEKWDPGPSLVHQTYGNLLDNLQRYDEALVERRKAVELEPAGWSYQGLGNTLRAMKRFDEAYDAFRESVRLAPDNPVYWRSWATALMAERKFAEAIVKLQKAVDVDPQYENAWVCWGKCLESTGDNQGALEKYEKALKLDPSDDYALSGIARLKRQLEKAENPGKQASE
jgi:tetratricopeptide (TPR) repeat protein